MGTGPVAPDPTISVAPPVPPLGARPVAADPADRGGHAAAQPVPDVPVLGAGGDLPVQRRGHLAHHRTADRRAATVPWSSWPPRSGWPAVPGRSRAASWSSPRSPSAARQPPGYALLTGLSPGKALDDEYTDFVDLCWWPRPRRRSAMPSLPAAASPPA